MPDSRPLSPAESVERALRVVPGVVEATVSSGGVSEGTEVRLVLADDTDESAVARAVHRMLRLQFGVGLDDDGVELVMDITDTARAVTRLPVQGSAPDDDVEGADAEVIDLATEIDGLLAELDRRSGRDFHADVLAAAVRHPAGSGAVPDAATDDEPDPGEYRLGIARLSVVSDHRRVLAVVTLVGPAGEVRGTAEGLTGDHHALEAVALATLRAVAVLTDCQDGFGIAAVSTPTVGEHEVAVVQVECTQHGETQRLTGASEVRDDVHQAVIRATLDAVNRRLPLLTPLS